MGELLGSKFIKSFLEVCSNVSGLPFGKSTGSFYRNHRQSVEKCTLCLIVLVYSDERERKRERE